MKKTNLKSVGNILINVLLYTFLTLCICTVFITITSKKDADGAAEIFGYQIRVVTSESMAKSPHTDVSDFEIKDIPLRSLIFVKVMPDGAEQADEWYGDLKVGDVLTFRYVYTTQITITHRITAITQKEDGGFIIELAGDNKDADDSQLYQIIDTSIPNNTNYVIGKVTGQSYILGIVLSFLMTPVAIVLIIILPCFVIILLEVIKIVKMFSSEKKKQMQNETAQKEAELEELRRRLAELEQQKNQTTDPNNTDKEG